MSIIGSMLLLSIGVEGYYFPTTLSCDTVRFSSNLDSDCTTTL